MKNIHVLPTEKPSRFYSTAQTETKKRGYSFGEHYIPNTRNMFSNHNIYITNDEEIKKGDFTLSPINAIVKCECEKSKKSIMWDNCKKIILTDNKYLIKEGVQAIDDEFLEWFVKNPSCEEVEVDWVDFSQSYFIKIPKEELKQETLEEDLDEIKNIRLWLKDRKQRFIKQFKNKQ